jgi:hypothetical protein
MVLIQGTAFDDPAFQATVKDAVANIQATGQVENLVGPAPDNNLRSADGRSALITFTVKGDSDRAKDRVGEVLAHLGTSTPADVCGRARMARISA